MNTENSQNVRNDCGHPESDCSSCGETFQDVDCLEICPTCIDDDMSCPGCAAQPGDGYTADCHHPEGCGYFKAAFGALSSRLPLKLDYIRFLLYPLTRV
jgi:hypothetical protein